MYTIYVKNELTGQVETSKNFEKASKAINYAKNLKKGYYGVMVFNELKW